MVAVTGDVLARLADEHGRLRYVGLGDSSTEGLCDPDGEGGWIGWSQRLAQRMADTAGSGIEWANLAVRGRTAHEVLTTQLPAAVALGPTVATVVAGMNDLLRIRPTERVLDDLGVVARTLVATGATVATVTLPDLADVVPLARPLRGRLLALNDGIRALADHGVVVADLAASPIATDPRLWAEDRLHANGEGHARIAEGIADTLGLPASTWTTAFTTPPTIADRGDDRAWRRTHLLPWLGRRLRRVSSGTDLAPRHPQWVTIRPAAVPAPRR